MTRYEIYESVDSHFGFGDPCADVFTIGLIDLKQKENFGMKFVAESPDRHGNLWGIDSGHYGIYSTIEGAIREIVKIAPRDAEIFGDDECKKLFNSYKC